MIQEFLERFTREYEKKNTLAAKALWLLETTGSQDAADLKAALDIEVKLLFQNRDDFQFLKQQETQDPLLARQKTLLLHAFTENLVSRELLEKISYLEAQLTGLFGNFRALLDGRLVSENEIRDILKQEKQVEKRKRAWNASKEIGQVTAPVILELVRLRNQVARESGYENYFTMQLALQEVDPQVLEALLQDVAARSIRSYEEVLDEIEGGASQRFHVDLAELGPWSWADPFCQEDPKDAEELDLITEGVDIVANCAKFYQIMGLGVEEILQRSDMYEREGKCQHAFCFHIDRKGDIRTLNNVKSSLKWLEVVMHELGHAVYEKELSQKLPYLLRQPSHTLTTEAMALVAGRQAYRQDSLAVLAPDKDPKLVKKVESSLKRRQLIFSRWVLVMTDFEKGLYQNPGQDLNKLWWHLVEKHQRIKAPKDRLDKADWAAKIHIGLAPVYYFSYLLGELLASTLEKTLYPITGSLSLAHPAAGQFLREKLFQPGASLHFQDLIQQATGKLLNADAWIEQFSEKV